MTHDKRQKIPTIALCTLCTTPPVGWICSLPPGHDGPCAARPDRIGPQRNPTCPGCGKPVEYNAVERGAVHDGVSASVWHFKCYVEAPDPKTVNLTPPDPDVVDPPRMIRWLEGKIRSWETLEAAAGSQRFRKQYAWQLLHARAILAVLRGLP